MLTNRTPSFHLLAAGSFILRLHLTTPSTQTSMSTALTIPATTPPKKMLMTRGALSVAVCKEIKKTQQDKYSTSYTQENTREAIRELSLINALNCLGCMHVLTWASCGVCVGDNRFHHHRVKQIWVTSR